MKSIKRILPVLLTIALLALPIVSMAEMQYIKVFDDLALRGSVGWVKEGGKVYDAEGKALTQFAMADKVEIIGIDLANGMLKVMTAAGTEGYVKFADFAKVKFENPLVGKTGKKCAAQYKDGDSWAKITLRSGRMFWLTGIRDGYFVLLALDGTEYLVPIAAGTVSIMNYTYAWGGLNLVGVAPGIQ